MELPQEILDMSKPGQKTTEVRVCEKHGSDYFDEVRLEEFGQYFWKCTECIKEDKEKRRKAWAIENAVEQLNLPPRLKTCSFDTYKPVNDNATEILAKCVEYVETWPHNGGGVMLGGVGTGKTHLAAAICSALCQKEVVSHITTVNLIVRDVRSAWGGKGELTEQNIINGYCDYYGLLVIDEIGSQYGSDSERVIVNEIINNRYEQMRPTIAMGNISISDAKSILGERVVDRLKHDGFEFFFEWDSYRK
jgi:DNA replication protein DnaC